MMTNVLHQKISRKRIAAVRPRGGAGRAVSYKPGAAGIHQSCPRHFLRKLGRIAGSVFSRVSAVFTLKTAPGPREETGRRTAEKKIFPGILKGIAGGVLAVLFFAFIAIGLIPHVRQQSLSLSLPEETLQASVLNAFLEDSPGDTPSEDGFQTPAGGKEFSALSVQNRRIESGETISSIAGKAGLSLDTLISFNHIQDVRKVPVGAQLKLPDRNGILYTVKRGDSLFSIAKAYSITTGAIADVNNLESSTIHAGQELFIPGARMHQFDLKKILGELFIRPTAGRLTSSFGMRPDPFTGVRRFHNGIDLAAPEGTSIFAAMAGKVVKVGVHAAYGRYIIVSHAGGYQSWYAHLRKPLVEQGRSVSQGQLIGEMGNTGYSTGPHLHFSIFKDGKAVDPIKFLQ
ncbi:MAG: M23 family metallopeptidase [Spirochaetales bacterium]|jgi:LysM repeat protein|nr:M23 family metallopeptidase [Spirochaetales bacterium]